MSSGHPALTIRHLDKGGHEMPGWPAVHGGRTAGTPGGALVVPTHRPEKTNLGSGVLFAQEDVAALFRWSQESGRSRTRQICHSWADRPPSR